MKKIEIMNSLLDLPQFVEVDSYKLHKGFTINLAEDWSRIFDIRTYNWIAINNNRIDYTSYSNGFNESFSIVDDVISAFIKKQRDFAAKLAEKTVVISELDMNEMIEKLENTEHLQKCSGITQLMETIDFFNLNNGKVLTVNKNNNNIMIDNILATCYFQKTNSICKLLEYEFALSCNTIVSNMKRYQL
jgi:hypothetical protein